MLVVVVVVILHPLAVLVVLAVVEVAHQPMLLQRVLVLPIQAVAVAVQLVLALYDWAAQAALAS